MSEASREALWLWAVMVFTPSSDRIWKLSANYDDIVEFTYAVKNHSVSGLNDKEIERADSIKISDVEKIFAECKAENINVYCYESEGYPSELKRTANPPAVLFSYGSLDFLNDKCIISVVGTRKPSDYSVEVTKHICSDLIERGALLVSGFADGIDQLANIVSLEKGQYTVAVCGAPLDREYPAGSAELKKRIVSHGAVISEYYPGYKPSSRAFTNRNRILVGISRAVLFIECSAKSHGLDSVQYAISQGKKMFVIPPHDIYDKRYFGQRNLIRNECQPVFGAEDIVYSLIFDRYDSLRLVKRMGIFSLPSEDSLIFADDVEEKKKTKKTKKAIKKVIISESVIEKKKIDYSLLNENEAKICKCLEGGNKLADDISAEIGIGISDVLSMLTELELDGLVKSLPGKLFSL